jgi:hypothetical protein
MDKGVWEPLLSVLGGTAWPKLLYVLHFILFIIIHGLMAEWLSMWQLCILKVLDSDPNGNACFLAIIIPFRI